MKLLVFALALMAFSAVCLGQTTGQTTPAFVPKSACGINALQCYTNQKAAMSLKFDIADFASACQIFKTILLCMDNGGACSTDTDYLAVRGSAISDQEGVCGVDGSIQSCGTDVQPCFNDMITVMADAISHNFSQACPLITTFAACVAKVKKTKDCSLYLYTKLTQIGQILDQYKELGGCDGPCAQAIAVCTLNATTLPTDDSILTVDFQAYCQSALKVYRCLQNLTATTVCATSLGGTGPGSYLQAITQNTLAQVGDICALDGSNSVCTISLSQCADDWIALSTSSSTDVVCKTSSEFLECISRLPCMTSLAVLVTNLRNKFETIEIERNCPSVGTCNERFAKCGLQDQGLDNVTQTDKSTVCPSAKSGISCFDFVKKDPYCINEYNSFSTEEQDLKRLYTQTCGALRLVPWSLSFFVALLIVCLKQQF